MCCLFKTFLQPIYRKNPNNNRGHNANCSVWLFQPLVKSLMKVYFCLTEILGKFELPIQSCPISLVFNFKCCSMLLIAIFNKIWLSLAAVCPSGPCFASLFGSACVQIYKKIKFGFKHTVKVILIRICRSFFSGHYGLRITLG